MRNTDINREFPAELARADYYRKILKVMDTLTRTGIIQRGRGSCISMSDLVKSMLIDQGIESDMVECQCTVTIRHPEGAMVASANNIIWVGHDDNNVDSVNNLDVDTHMVVITRTPTPILIDTSIIGMAPGINYIAEPFVSTDNTIATLRFNHSLWVYSRKIRSKMPKHYQDSISDRIQTDLRVARNMRILAAVVILALLISLGNALRGAYDFWLIYHEENGWGPNSMQELIQKVENIEQQLIKDKGK